MKFDANFRRRLRIYLVGVFLGCLVTWAVLLRKRNMNELFAWTPNGRVLGELRSDTGLIQPGGFWCTMECYGFNSEDYRNLLTDGDVDFSNSDTRVENKKYVISYETEDRGTLRLVFVFDDEVHRLVEVTKVGETIECDCP